MNVNSKQTVPRSATLMNDGSLEELAKSVEESIKHMQRYEIAVQYRNLTFWNEMPELTIQTVGSVLTGASGEKKRVNVINDLTGRILPKRMTLVMGPPGSGKYSINAPCIVIYLLIQFPGTGKSSFLKALAGQLAVGSGHLEGEILYNGAPIDSGKYLVSKIAAYSDEKEQHAGPLTVRETLEFAWKMTTAGHHSYGLAKDAESAAILDQDDEHMVQVNNCFQSSNHACNTNHSHSLSLCCR